MATGAAAGVLPMALSGSAGWKFRGHRIISFTLLTLLVLPTVYYRIEGRREGASKNRWAKSESIRMERRGIEPLTPCLQSRCSPN
jgi:hypothetical protein